MDREDGDTPDPRVLSDPLAEDAEDAGDAAPPESSAALVPVERGLAPFDPFRRYLAEIRKYPALDAEAERALARRYRDTADREALFRLVTSNLMLVVRVAYSFRRAARNLLDLVQEGNLGLLHAVERFDPELGVRLPTYAAWWVRAYMVKFLLDNVRLVRVGTTNARRRLLRNLRREKERLESMGYDVGPRLLAEHFGVSQEDVRDVQLALASRDVSLDETVGEDGERTRAESLADPHQPDAEAEAARAELQRQTEAAITEFRRDLAPRDLALLEQRILAEDPLTLQQIGDRFGTTREAVRQAEARLLKRLTAFMRERLGDQGQVAVRRESAPKKSR